MASPPQSPKKLTVSTKDDISRRGLSKSENVNTPITPPTRYISSNFSTPSSSYGREEDAIILELSPRYIKAGLEGESHAIARYDFRPSDTRRVGDYREYLPSHARADEDFEAPQWGRDYELWRNDIQDLDLGLLSDRLERALREIYNKYLLLDAGNSRLVIVVPSLVAHPVLEAILRTLFERWTIPSIALYPASATALVAAGLRSGLVVDIGWEETVVTVCHEYREIRTYRSIRGMKMLTQELGRWLKQQLPQECVLDLAAVEDLLTRISPHILKPGATHNEASGDKSNRDLLEIEWPTSSFVTSASLPRVEIDKLFTKIFLGKDDEDYPDDEELPLHWVIYKALLWLSADVRGVCISRIVFTGDGVECSNMPSLILDAFKKLLNARGWSDVVGSKIRINRDLALALRLRPLGSVTADASHDHVVFSDEHITEERYLREKQKHTQAVVHTVVRQVDSLGSWTGASLLTNLKVKSFVEIYRDRFLSHGIAGASRLLEQNVLSQRMSAGATRAKGERTSWTMAGWA